MWWLLEKPVGVERERVNWGTVGSYCLSFLFLALGASSSRLGGGSCGSGATGGGVHVPDGSGHTKSRTSSQQ